MLSDLSHRHKLPLAFTAAIVLTAVALGATNAAQSYRAARAELLAGAERLARALAGTLSDAIRKDAVWPAYVTVSGVAGAARSGTTPPVVVVLDASGRVFVSSAPERFPVLTRPDPGLLGGAGEIAGSGGRAAERAAAGARQPPLSVAAPIPGRDGPRGRVVLLYSRDALLPPLLDIVRATAWTALLALLALVPLAWYWGGRVAAPLVQLAEALGRVATDPPDSIRLPPVRGDDEIGRLTARVHDLLRDLSRQRAVERQMVATERLAAVGRLAAGVAHEINNPLAGMMTALDTYRHHRSGAPLGERTVSLLERGLLQIKEIVSALLVEARLETHPLSPDDIEDVRTLVLPEARKREARLEWESDLAAPVALPSTQVRQVLMNLVLNALGAVRSGGAVACRVRVGPAGLRIVVDDDGCGIPPAEVEHLFEPFVRRGDGPGHGLGLWVTYQIVRQLRGEISVESAPDLTRFEVELPLAS